MAAGCGDTGLGGTGACQPPAPTCHRKEILEEYYSISSLVQEDMLAVHRAIASAIQAIKPDTEYSSFIRSHRYDPARRSHSARRRVGRQPSPAGCPQVRLRGAAGRVLR